MTRAPTLAGVQSLLSDALRRPARAKAAAPLFDGEPGRIEALIGVYRGNRIANALKALRAAYPVVAALVGDEFFEALGRAYLRAHPASSGDLNSFGDGLPGFVDEFEPARPLAYLADVTRIEWAVHRAYGAEDAMAPTQAALGAALASDPALARLRLSAGTSLLACASPAGSIWLAHQGAGDLEAIDPAIAELVLVFRSGLDTRVEVLADADARFVAATLDGRPLGEALDAALAADTGFDLGATLRRWLVAGLLAGVDVHSGG